MKKIIVVTWCTDDWRQLNTLENLEKSFKYFHPNIDFYVFNTQDTIEEVKKYPWLTKNWMNPVSFLRFIDNYDMFVHLDGDTIITGNLDDLFNSNEDIIGVRNMNNFGNAGAHNWGEFVQVGNMQIPALQFLNAGLVGINNKEFLKEWFQINYFCSMNPPTNMYDEQGTLNYIFHSKKYTTKLLDDVTLPVSYGQSNAWGSGDNHWESWSKMYVKNNQLFLDDPVTNKPLEIKVLHQAGGHVAFVLNSQHNGYRNWLRTIVNKDVNDYIDEITK